MLFLEIDRLCNGSYADDISQEAVCMQNHKLAQLEETSKIVFRQGKCPPQPVQMQGSCSLYGMRE